MATVIDALVVTLGLDPKKFTEGQKKARDDLDKTKKQTQQTAKDMERYGKQAASFFTQIRNEALTLFAVLAIGGGLKSFITGTIHSAAQLGFMAQNLGMSTQRLSAWQMAAERAGGSAQGITAQLQESQQAAAQFHMGMTGEGAQWFFRMGGNANDLKDGNSYLLARARIIHSLYQSDPGRAALIAQRMGISADTFNLLKQGPAAVLALVDAQKKNAVVTEAQSKKALALENKWRDIRDAFRATSIEILFNLMPVFNDLTAAIKEGADWVVKHRKDIKEWVDSAVKGLTEFAHEADGAAQSVGGWKTVLEALLALKVLGMAGNLLRLGAALTSVGKGLGLIGVSGVGMARLTGLLALLYSKDLNTDEDGALDASRSARNQVATASRDGLRKYMMEAFVANGLSNAVAAGVIGSVIGESGLNPNAVNPKSGAAGLFQYLGARKVNFIKEYGVTPDKATPAQQISFALGELHGPYKKVFDMLKRARTPEEASDIFTKYFEAPGAKEMHLGRRRHYAQETLAWAKQHNALGHAYLPPTTQSRSVNYSTASVGHGNTVTSETHIGKVEVHTNATDANGIARDMHGALKHHHLIAQANGGLN